MNFNRNNKSEKILTKGRSKSIELSPKDFVPIINITPFQLKQFYHNDDDKKDAYILRDCYYDFDKGVVRIAANPSKEAFEKRVSIKVYRADCEGDLSFTNMERNSTVKEIQSAKMLNGRGSLSAKNFFSIQMKSYKNSARNLLHLNFEFLLPSFFFQLKKMSGIGLEETKLLQYITSNETVTGRRILPISTGYLSFTKKRRLKLYLSDDQEVYQVPICGFWIQNCPKIESVEMVVHMIRFILVKSFKEKIYQYGRTFFIVFFDERNKPIFYSCRLLGLRTTALRYSILNYRVEVDMMKNLFSPLRIKFSPFERQQPIIYTFPPSNEQRRIPNPSKSMSIPRKGTGPYQKLSPPSPKKSSSPVKPYVNTISSPWKKNNGGKHRSLPSSPVLPSRNKKGETVDLGTTLNIPSLRPNGEVSGNDEGVQNVLYTEKNNGYYYNKNYQQISWKKLSDLQRKYPHRYPIMFLHQPNSYYTMEKVCEEYAKLQNMMISSRDETFTQFREMREEVAKEMHSMRNEHREQMKELKEYVTQKFTVVDTKLEKIESKEKKVECEIRKIRMYVKESIDKVEKDSKQRIMNNHQIMWDNYDDEEEDDDDEQQQHIEFEDNSRRIEENNKMKEKKKKMMMKNNISSSQVQRREYTDAYLSNSSGGGYRHHRNHLSSSMNQQQHHHQQVPPLYPSSSSIKNKPPDFTDSRISNNRRGGGRRRKENNIISSDIMVVDVGEEEQEEEQKKDNNNNNKKKKKMKNRNVMYNNHGGGLFGRSMITTTNTNTNTARSDMSSPSSSTTTFSELPKIRVRGKVAESTISSLVEDDDDDDDIMGGVSSESGFKTTEDFDDLDDDDDDDDDDDY